jgi:hypothetical protein
MFNAEPILVDRPERKILFERPRHRWKEHIEMFLI